MLQCQKYLEDFMARILITSVSAGAGHVRAASAIEQYLVNQEHTVENYDLMTFSKTWFKTVYATHYMALINHLPTLWKTLYTLSDRPTLKANFKTRRWVEYKSHNKFFEYLENFQPDLVISSHFMPPEILHRFQEKTGKHFKIAVVVTDFDVHYLWVHPRADYYFVAGELAKNKLISYGIAPEKIVISGIPVMPQFLQSYNYTDLEKKWQFQAGKKRLLIMAGGAGIGNLEGTCKKILERYPDLEVIALAGKNEKLLASLEKLQKKYPDNFHPMGFTKEVHELMFLSDLVITKPGGLSTSECLLMKKPMLLINPIPGQEEHNATMLCQAGVAVLADNLLNDVHYMLANLKRFQDQLNALPTLDTKNIIVDGIQKLVK